MPLLIWWTSRPRGPETLLYLQPKNVPMPCKLPTEHPWIDSAGRCCWLQLWLCRRPVQSGTTGTVVGPGIGLESMTPGGPWLLFRNKSSLFTVFLFLAPLDSHCQPGEYTSRCHLRLFTELQALLKLWRLFFNPLGKALYVALQNHNEAITVGCLFPLKHWSVGFLR